MGEKFSEGAIVQHLAKLRQKMEQHGIPVPPAMKRGLVTKEPSKVYGAHAARRRASSQTVNTPQRATQSSANGSGATTASTETRSKIRTRAAGKQGHGSDDEQANVEPEMDDSDSDDNDRSAKNKRQSLAKTKPVRGEESDEDNSPLKGKSKAKRAPSKVVTLRVNTDGRITPSGTPAKIVPNGKYDDAGPASRTRGRLSSFRRTFKENSEEEDGMEENSALDDPEEYDDGDGNDDEGEGESKKHGRTEHEEGIKTKKMRLTGRGGLTGSTPQADFAGFATQAGLSGWNDQAGEGGFTRQAGFTGNAGPAFASLTRSEPQTLLAGIGGYSVPVSVLCSPAKRNINDVKQTSTNNNYHYGGQLLDPFVAPNQMNLLSHSTSQYGNLMTQTPSYAQTFGGQDRLVGPELHHQMNPAAAMNMLAAVNSLSAPATQATFMGAPEWSISDWAQLPPTNQAVREAARGVVPELSDGFTGNVFEEQSNDNQDQDFLVEGEADINNDIFQWLSDDVV